VRRIAGVLLAAHVAAGLIVPLTTFGRTDAAMACCMMSGRCDCVHSDASFARCTGQDSVRAAAPAPAIAPQAAPRLASLPPSRRPAPDGDRAADLFRCVPPTPPPRIAAA
jgi:hypothetical protein